LWLEPMLRAVADALPFALAGDDDRYQAEVMRLAPAAKFSPRQAARGE
ncbi:MAG TPA: aminoacyl-tRNA hydrolase, partial [Brevundimonas sp.]|nr:aminoacyl-tRNA hydrolase [Brevundimonas sp.]